MNHIDLTKYSSNLKFNNGIWYPSKRNEIYFPLDAHNEIFTLEDKSFWFAHRNNCIIEAIKNFPPDSFIIDIGGGNGFVSCGLEKNGIGTLLVEPEIEGIMNAKKRKLNNLICSSFEDAHFKKNSLPSIGLFDVFEHIKDDDSFISKLYETLVFEGRLYLTVPAYNILWSVEDDYAEHFRRYTLEKIAYKLETSNFQIEYKTYIFSFLPIPILLFRSIPWRFSKKKQRHAEKTKKQFLQQGNVKKILLNIICKKELSKIRRKEKIPFGSSCLLVAKKKSSFYEHSI